MMLIVDSFAGGGGASTGIEMALGRSPDIAINHDAVALGMHAANHPQTVHITENVWKVNIDDYTKGQPVGLLWASPDCRHFSRARGSAPVSNSVRGLAWSIVKFVRQLGRNKPCVILMENVEEFKTWEDFDAWKKALKKHGYRIEMKALRACDYGAPTIRKRLFIVMRCDGQPIVWPDATHAPKDCDDVISGDKLPWRPASEIIDWSLPCPSIFDTSQQIKDKHGLRAVRPLADNTMRRVAAGVKRYVLDASEPFFVTYGQHGGGNRSAADPIHTITASKKDQNAIVVPMLSRQFGNSVGQSVDQPAPTVTAGGGGHTALVAAFMAQHNSLPDGINPGRSVEDPLATVTTRATQSNLVACHLSHFYSANKGNGGDLNLPLGTVSAQGQHAALVSAFMVKYYGQGIGQHISEPLHSITTKDRFGLVKVSIGGADYVITDIGMRMLSPRELFRAQGFPDNYEITRQANGKAIGKTQAIHKCGNSVSPSVAQAIASANCGFLKMECAA